MNNINICIAGLGNVGSALVHLIEKNAELVKNKSDLNINVIGLSAKNKTKKRNFNIEKYFWVDDPMQLLNIKDEKPDVLIELIGYEKDISYELVKSALKQKISVVTGNKAMLAMHGNELFNIAEKNKVLLLFEAAVAGGIPIIKTIKNNIFLNKINKISGILNGTTNYILTTMESENKSFEDVLTDAKQKGFTSDHESKLDIGGYDAAHKLTILSSICFGIPLNFESIYIEGIESIELDDLNYAKDLGYAIKHLAIGRKNNDGIELRVHSCLIPKTRLIANVDGVKNAVVVSSDAAGPTLYYGAGAGSLATASSVVSDIIDISRKKLSESNNSVPLLSYQRNELQNKKILDINEIESRYYLRIRVTNKPGVLADITKIFGSKSISIESILQKEDLVNDENVPIVLVTHEVVEKNIIEALKDIEKLEVVKGKIIKIRIEELES